MNHNNLKKIFRYYLCVLIFITNLLSKECHAQFNSNFYYRDTYSKQANFDSLIRTALNNNLTESYYLITTPLIGATTSWAPQFIQIWNRIKKNSNDIVLLCYSNGGLRKKDREQFLHELFKLKDEEIKKIKFIYNDELYETIAEKRNLIRLQYYFRGNLYYNEDGKWHHVKNIILPEEQINIKQTAKIKLIGIDSLMLFERDALYPYKKDHLLILADAKNEILELNTQTGEIKPILKISDSFKASDLYCQYFANDSTECNLAKKEEDFYKKLNRKIIEVESLKFYENKLILSVSIQAVEKLKNDYHFLNDLGLKTKFESGSKSLNLFSFIMEYDLMNKSFKVHKLIEIPETKKRAPYIMDANGIYVKGNTILTSTHSWHKKGLNSFGLVKLDLVNNNYIPTIEIEPKNKKSGLLQEYYSKNFFLNFNDSIYFTTNICNELYLVGRNKSQAMFYGNGSKPYSIENYAKYFEDTVTNNINFQFHDIKPIINKKYILAFCIYKNEPIFELKNRMLKTVDIIEAKKVKGLERYLSSKYRLDLLIDDDKIYYKSLENDEIYLNIFSITEH